MSERRVEFKRMVLGLPQSPRDYPAVAATAQLAGLLRLDLLATFVEDATLIDVAGLPCVRELRALEGGWRPMDISQLARELEHAAATARRLFAEAMRTCSIEAEFSFVRGSAAEVIPSLAMAYDIIVLIEPGNPAERVTQQFTRLVDAAFRAAAAVMIVPSAVTRTKGPIVVIASGPDDPSIFAGLGIAAAANERLIVIPLSNDADSFVALAGRASAVGVRFEVVSVTQRRPTASGLAMSFSHLSERLMVISRGSLDEAFPTEIASLRGIPVLVTEPDVEKVAAPCHYGGREALTP